MARLVRAAGLVMVPVLLLAGCNSSTTKKKTDQTPDQKGASASASKDPIKIGGVVSKTSASGYSKADTDLGAKARFMMANDAGGVNGRKIDYIGSEDDGQDPARTTTAVRKLVQQDHVFAVVPVNTTTIGGSADFLKDNKTPYIGWGTLPAFCNQEYGMGYNGCLVPMPGGSVNTSWPGLLTAILGGDAKGKSVALVTQDTDAGKFGLRTYQQAFPPSGFTVSYGKSTVPGTTVPTDWSPWVSEIMSSNNGKAPDVVVSIMQTPANIGLFTALKRAGFTGVLTDATDYDPALLKQASSKEALQDVQIFVQNMPFESDLPEMGKFKEYLSKAKGSPVTEWNQSMMVGWNSADLFLAIAAKAGDNLTVESFQASAANFSDTYPLVGDRKFPVGRKDSFGCGAMVQLKGDKYTITAPYKCYPTVPFK
ncbi:ABC transporter substrate-binding protein [Yinghuangia seranimata]|uniref:ABC transporter substrate-binding protein n=1 Tax=Yinghuangia seranimata TaxID=408067 RepID=UPI00248CBA04|nr:ABC transporter substrate-binding protein [Yinghuangia seranimata]MDI2130765.1 ABC transporter substrate-binding protein [Yinghuangia seranimata]